MSIAEISTKTLNGLIDGRYELQELLGNGGMGAVYRALQRPIGREVAVKLLRRSSPAGHDREVRRFFKEARSIASLHHPNIIPLYDFGQCESGDIYMVMELLPGASLANVMAEEGPMPFPRVAYVLDQVLDALQEAHKHNIVHRDLKPDNIQIGKRGEREDFVTVLDFGIARESNLGDSPTSTTIEVCGTPAYMAPEQILGSSVDPRADLYSVGVLLFEMVTGHLPFPMDRTIDLYMAHLKDEPPRVDGLIKDTVPAGLQELLDRVLTKGASDRIPDAASFRRALRSIAGLSGGSTQHTTGSSLAPICMEGGIELVAAIEPARSTGVDQLLQDWALDIAQAGGHVREKKPGCIVATFPGLNSIETAMRTALVLKKRTRTQRLSVLRPIYLRVGIHTSRELAERLCDDAPRGGIVVGSECVAEDERPALRQCFRLEPAGQVRFRGHRGPVKLLHLISGR